MDDILSFHAGKVIARSGDELFSGNPDVVPELQYAHNGDKDAYAFEALKRATLQPDLFRWQPYPVHNVDLVAAELRYEARMALLQSGVEGGLRPNREVLVVHDVPTAEYNRTTPTCGVVVAAEYNRINPTCGV